MTIEPDGLNSDGLNRIVRDELVQLNPANAAEWGIADGDPGCRGTPRHSLTGVASIDARIPVGVVATTTLFGQLAIELQMSEDINPMARVPGLDVEPCAVVSLAT